jgi:hypothetical protein
MRIHALRTGGGPVLALALLTACGAEPETAQTGALPPAALATFQDYLDRVSGDALVCPAAEVAAASRAGHVDTDGQPDFIIEGRALNCRSTRGEAAVGYFCGSRACAFPLLLSQGGAWRVVTGLSGNELSLVEHYRETRIQLREPAAGLPGSGVSVREYVWRDGELVRIGTWVETPEARLETP